jgi:hypothetical protein
MNKDISSNLLPQEEKTQLLLDADVLIHFHKADKIFDLSNIFKQYEYILLDIVWEEVKKTSIAYAIQLLIDNGSITLLEFPTDDDLIDYEYEALKYEGRGVGESACMAYAKYNKNGIIASSNLSDLLPYCQNNKIPYLTTIDFLCQAMAISYYLEADCDTFIEKVLGNRSNLPIKRMSDYDCFNRKILKYR